MERGAHVPCAACAGRAGWFVVEQGEHADGAQALAMAACTALHQSPAALPKLLVSKSRRSSV